MRAILVLPLLVCLSISSAIAEPLGIGVTQSGGPYYNMAVPIAKEVQDREAIELRFRTHRGTSQYVPLVNSGELELGLGSTFEVGLAYAGTGPYEGRRQDDLRVVGAVLPFWMSLIVPQDSPARTVADLKGMRGPGRFTAAAMVNILIDGLISNGGLTRDDLKSVPVSGFREMMNAFVSGDLDFVMAELTSGSLIQLENRMGPIRALSLSTAENDVLALQKHVPVAQVRDVRPGKGFLAVAEPIHVMSYNIVLFTNKNVPDDVIYKLVKTIYDGRAEMAAALSGFGQIESAGMAGQFGVPYHAGAERFYRERGAWAE